MGVVEPVSYAALFGSCCVKRPWGGFHTSGILILLIKVLNHVIATQFRRLYT